MSHQDGQYRSISAMIFLEGRGQDENVFLTTFLVVTAPCPFGAYTKNAATATKYEFIKDCCACFRYVLNYWNLPGTCLCYSLPLSKIPKDGFLI